MRSLFSFDIIVRHFSVRASLVRTAVRVGDERRRKRFKLLNDAGRRAICGRLKDRVTM